MIIQLVRRLSYFWNNLLAGFATDKKICSYTLALFALSLAIPNNKFFFLLAALYVAAIFWHTRSAGATYLYGFLALQIYFIGQRYEFLVIAPELLLKNTLYPNGRHLLYTVMPSFIVAASAAFSLPFTLLRSYRSSRFPLSFVSYGLLLSVGLVSSIYSQVMPTLAVLYTLDSVFVFGWLIATYSFLKSQTGHMRQKLLTTSFIIIIFSVLFESGITIVQYVKRDVIGLHIEGTRSVAPFGFGPDENPLQFRPVGLTYHANMLAARLVALFYAIILMSNILSLHSGFKKIRYLGWLGAIICLFTVVLTQSRVGYASLLLPLLTLALLHKSHIISWIHEIRQRVKPYLVLFVPLVAVASFVLVDRLLYLRYAFLENAGWKTRELLIREALKLIIKHPLLGVGTGMFIPAAFNEQRYETIGVSIMRYFPESVHNGFFLLLSENGIFGLLLFLATIFLIVNEALRGSFTFTTKSLIIAGIAGNLIFMTMQPASMGLPINILIYYLFAAHAYAQKIHT